MSEKFLHKAQDILNERFNHDVLIALATIDGNIPWVRTVNSYYENSAFFVITYALSNKMRTAFAEWYNNGHTNEADPNTCILCIHLTDGVLLSHGTRYDIDFTID